MDYKIIAADAALGQIEVTYLKDGDAVATYTIDVPIVGGYYITGETLNQEIIRRAPLWLMERKIAASNAPNFANIAALVQSETVADVANPNGPGKAIVDPTTLYDVNATLVDNRSNQTVVLDTITPSVTTL